LSVDRAGENDGERQDLRERSAQLAKWRVHWWRRGRRGAEG
jgi:hypothetical protein